MPHKTAIGGMSAGNRGMIDGETSITKFVGKPFQSVDFPLRPVSDGLKTRETLNNKAIHAD